MFRLYNAPTGHPQSHNDNHSLNLLAGVDECVVLDFMWFNIVNCDVDGGIISVHRPGPRALRSRT